MTVDGALFWWLPDDPNAEHGDDVDIGAAWGAGFLDGMELRSDAWDAWIAKDDWIGEVEAYVEALAVGSYPPEEEGGAHAAELHRAPGDPRRPQRHAARPALPPPGIPDAARTRPPRRHP